VPSTTVVDATAQSRDLGVNAFHFTPLEARGQSDSAYSIADQLRYDASALLPTTIHCARASSADQRRPRAFQFLADAARTETHALLFADIVLNHTADNSPWLAEQPDAAYNTRNSPHLRVAYALDCAMVEFSATLERERRNAVRSHGDVEALVGEFFDRALPACVASPTSCVDDCAARRAGRGPARRARQHDASRRLFCASTRVGRATATLACSSRWSSRTLRR
jgi:hypothetical protein